MVVFQKNAFLTSASEIYLKNGKNEDDRNIIIIAVVLVTSRKMYGEWKSLHEFSAK